MAKCFLCNGEVIWGGDENAEDLCGRPGIASNWTCSECGAEYEIYQWQDEEEEEENNASE